MPKKLWAAKMGELLMQHSGGGGPPVASSFTSVRAGAVALNARSFVDDVKRLRYVFIAIWHVSAVRYRDFLLADSGRVQ